LREKFSSRPRPRLPLSLCLCGYDGPLCVFYPCHLSTGGDCSPFDGITPRVVPLLSYPSCTIFSSVPPCRYHATSLSGVVSLHCVCRAELDGGSTLGRQDVTWRHAKPPPRICSVILSGGYSPTHTERC
ncbi:unnamed protein product, partial [Ectocarpus sp. 12 AP-2014]